MVIRSLFLGSANWACIGCARREENMQARADASSVPAVVCYTVTPFLGLNVGEYVDLEIKRHCLDCSQVGSGTW